MKPRNMNVVIGGKRYQTATATLLASGPSDKGHLGQAGAEPEPILEVRLGGVELGALVIRGNWERLGQHAFLFRTPKGNYFVQHQSSLAGERDQLVPLDQGDAISFYERLPNKEVTFEEAFPGVEIEDA